jgi:hypothetical protein
MNRRETVSFRLRKFAMVRNTLAASAVMAAILLLSPPVFAQTSQGTIQGTVADQTGGAIARATVSVIDAARGITRTLITDSAGAYVAPNLTPGPYTVRAEAMGFQTVDHPNVNVEVGQSLRVDFSLQPGAQNQTITVTSEVPAINTTDATLGGTVSNQAINALPLNGRNYQRLLQLRPGVVAAIGQGTGSASSNGLRAGQNVTFLEGLVTIGPLGGGDILNTAYHQGDSTSLLPIDAVQEFNVQQYPKAEYGWGVGAVQNVGVKSGTNTIHGTAYAFGRDSALDASNEFLGSVVPMELQQYGATAGGHIIKDKLFWFLGYEKLQYSVGDSANPTVPSDYPTQLTGPTLAQDPNASLTFVDACLALPSGRASVNPLSALLAGLPPGSCVPQQASSTPGNLFENVFPFVTTAPVANKAVTYAPGLITQNPIHNGIAKLDYNINAANHLSGMYFVGYAQSTVQTNQNQLFPQWQNAQESKIQDYNGSWVWTPNSSWVNEFRGGYAQNFLKAAAVDENVNDANTWPTGYGMNTGVTNPQYGGFPQITIKGFNGFLGMGPQRGIRGPAGTIDLVDHVSYLRGKHAFKFGFEVLDEIGTNNAYSRAAGKVAFSSLQNFLSGTVQNGQIFLGNALQVTRALSYAGFAQDDWRVTPRITLNLGLRYEFNAPPTGKNDFIANFYPNANPATTSAIGQAGGAFPPLYNGDYWDFSPRFGAAWDVRGDGKTVVRIAASLMYNLEPQGVLIDLNPLGANVPSVGYNSSGTAINANTPSDLHLAANQINWNTTGGTVFPTGLTLNYGGPHAGTYTGLSCTATGDPNILTLGYVATPCSFLASTDPNFKTPHVGQWSLDIQHAITNTLSVEAAYVGNHGRLAGQIDVNQPPVGAGWTAARVTACLNSALTNFNNCKVDSNAETQAQTYYNQFPYLQNISQNCDCDFSNYEALQVTVTERASNGLTFLAGYTLSHALSSTTSSGSSPADMRNLSHNYGTTSSDSRNRFTFSMTYAVPGRKAPGQMLQGWTVSPIVSAYGAQPWTASDATNDIIGTAELNNTATGFQPWNYSGLASAFNETEQSIPCYGKMSGCKAFATLPGGAPPAVCQAAAQAPYAGNAQLQQLALASLYDIGCYVQGGGVLTPPAYGTIGNAGQGFFRAQPFYNVDLSIAKKWTFRERYSAEFRAEFFNLFNRADFAGPGSTDPSAGGSFGQAVATPDETGFTNSVLGSGSARSAQFGLKLVF